MIYVFEWHNGFPQPVNGDKVVIADTTQALVRPFNSETDSESMVIGVVHSKKSRLVEISNAFDGPIYALYGQYLTDEDLSHPEGPFGEQLPNPAYQPINPASDTSLVFVATGLTFTAVKKPYTGSPLILAEFTNYDWCLI